MSLLKKLAGLAVGAAAVGAVAYVLQNREHHDDEYEHIWGPEDEVDAEDGTAETAEPADDASAEAEEAPAVEAAAELEELLEMEVTPEVEAIDIPITENLLLSANDIGLLMPFVHFTEE